MTSTGLYLGIDGGGTKTEFICIDDAGEVRARHVTGTTYHLQVGVDEVVRRLSDGIAAICQDLTIDASCFSFAFFGLPAFGEDRVVDPQLRTACGQVIGHDRYFCGNDMICGWAGSLDGKDGINLVAGTGSIGYGERCGIAARIGGWGELFGDEGSAYWIAIQGLNAFSRCSDGRAAKGVLHQIFAVSLALDADIDLCERVMGKPGMTREEIAGLARLVARAADEGDEAATEILAMAGDELAEMAIALRAKLGFGPDQVVPISWSGSVLKQQHFVRTTMIGHLERVGGFAATEPCHDPSYGAALYARMLRDRL
jgi:N-acetylglucosamine kinase-like BadF-type ATPase